jgi:hypothetical protein
MNEKETKEKKKVVIQLLATNAHVIFWNNIFCNTISTPFVTLLQHRFCASILQ